ncbi:outer membrane beta-barrel protein [Rhodopila sp.]|uniref:outer membrane beta-barrel protein n=1 Tax=Rhodopila sp. TaxID=2480087 RepID=UPI002BD2CC93|nr:outer membrane beta-barrel protein [Rhodopila sp.]HVZ08116.1 outer membrane beta-barrel protein [Rhodopila sp.]
MRVRASIRWSIVAALSAAVPYQAAAQRQMLPSLFPEGVPGYDTAPGVTVRSRLHPDWTPQGVRAGALRIFPTLDVVTGYDSNIQGNAGGGRGGWQVTTSPGITAATDWSRDQVGASVNLDSTQYPGMPAQNQTNGTAAAGARLDIGQDQLTIAAAHVARHEQAGAINTLASTLPISVQVNDLRASYAVNRGRWSLTPALDLAGWHYGDATINGQPASQGYRDRMVADGSLALRYQLAPLRNLLFVMRALGQSYTNVPAGQPSADSQAYQALAGLDYDIDALWRLRLLAGGESRQFSAAAYKARNTLIAEAEVTWFPTQLTTLHLALGRDTQDAAQEGVAGLVYTAARLSIDHELRRNLILNVYAAWQQAAYFGGGQQTGYAAGAGLVWALNRSMRLSVTYDQTDLRGGQNSAGSLSTGYTRGLSLLSLHFGL